MRARFGRMVIILALSVSVGSASPQHDIGNSLDPTAVQLSTQLAGMGGSMPPGMGGGGGGMPGMGGGMPGMGGGMPGANRKCDQPDGSAEKCYCKIGQTAGTSSFHRQLPNMCDLVLCREGQGFNGK